METETYLNPWKTIIHPKIVEFDSNGDLKLKDTSEVHILNVVPIIEALRAEEKPLKASGGSEYHPPEWLKGSAVPISTLVNDLRSVIAKKTRSKILTRCNRSRCNFLACQNIKKHCVLCEVNMGQLYHIQENSTNCKIVDTSFLSK